MVSTDDILKKYGAREAVLLLGDLGIPQKIMVSSTRMLSRGNFLFLERGGFCYG